MLHFEAKRARVGNVFALLNKLLLRIIIIILVSLLPSANVDRGDLASDAIWLHRADTLLVVFCVLQLRHVPIKQRRFVTVHLAFGCDIFLMRAILFRVRVATLRYY